MAIPENQLQTWSHQGAVVSAKETVASVKHALGSYSWPDGLGYDVYLKGSYKNDTNIRGDSDVDIVVELNSCFHSNLSQEEERRRGIISMGYSFVDFRRLVLDALVSHYGTSKVSLGNKSVKIRGTRLPADVVPCMQYLKYREPSRSNSYIVGMVFWTLDTSRRIVNYPKVHYRYGIHKNTAGGGYWKATVRIFKNIRSRLVQTNIISKNVAPSYFVECLLYNVPDRYFSHNRQQTVCDVVNWLRDARLEVFWCQNGQSLLFGQRDEQWSINRAKEFLEAVGHLWENYAYASVFRRY